MVGHWQAPARRAAVRLGMGITMSDKQQIGRLAFRLEGEIINAYWADQDTMEGAILLGSFRARLADLEPKLWEGFKTLMRAAMDVVLLTEVGTAGEWGGEERAPEHERSGRA